MKLKTLKDVPIGWREEILLKAEAIKWVKELSNKDCKHIKVGGLPVTITSFISEETRAVFQKFFNITEEDLK